MTRQTLSAALLMALLASPAMAQVPFQSGSTGADGAFELPELPPSRDEHRMAYDSDRQVVVLFGGESAGGTTPDNRTWEWNGAGWTERETKDAPSLRHQFGLVYDKQRQRVVMFGGEAQQGGVLNETWEYDGANWMQVAPTASPAARSGFGMVYDSTRNRVVLFGGIDGSGTRLNDTWVFDGSTWTELTTSGPPSAREVSTMTYDSGRDRVVLLSGYAGGTNPLFDTWEFDGVSWQDFPTATAPDGVFRDAGTVLTYDPQRCQSIFLSQNTNGTWAWGGSSWQKLLEADASPFRRDNSAMIYDEARQQVVLFGGRVNSSGNDTFGPFPRVGTSSLGQSERMSETWILDSVGWSAPPEVQPEVIVDLNTKPDGIFHYTTIHIGAGRLVGFKRNSANTPVTWLASGDVEIDGVVHLRGESSTVGASGLSGAVPRGGPGGFDGGLGSNPSDEVPAAENGGGPGGGPADQSGLGGGNASFGTLGAGTQRGSLYGNPELQPLIGGSGGGGELGAGAAIGRNGGAGGGAILIASSTTVTLRGVIDATGGAGFTTQEGIGSGGGVRIVANRIALLGSSEIDISGGRPFFTSSLGRIRLEAPQLVVTTTAFPTGVVPSTTIPTQVQKAGTGTITVTSVAGQGVPAQPSGSVATPDVTINQAGPVTISLATTGIPQGTVISVTVTVRGQVVTAQSSPTDASGNASATLTVPAGVGRIETSATYNTP